MKRAYKRRSQDFKRRILKRLHECTYSELLEEEFKWLAMIKNSELSKKYYNQHKNSKHWASLDNSKSIGQKISESHKKNPNWGKWNKGKKLSEETKQKLREANFKQFQDPEQVELRRKKSIELWQDPEYRQLQVSKKVGIKRKPMTEETKLKISKAKKGKYFGPVWTKELREQVSKKVSETKLNK